MIVIIVYYLVCSSKDALDYRAARTRGDNKPSIDTRGDKKHVGISMTDWLVEEIIAVNDIQLAMNGVYENIYNAVGGVNDVYFTKISTTADWFSYGSYNYFN
jgi:hypothetical protein